MDTRPVRVTLLSAFSDDELRALCFDHFHPVYDQIAAGMTKGQIVQLLLDHCSRRPGALDTLVTIIEQERPGLLASTPPPSAHRTGQLPTPPLPVRRVAAIVLLSVVAVTIVTLREPLSNVIQSLASGGQGAAPNPPGLLSGAPAGTALLYSTLDDPASVATPQKGIGGQTSLAADEFVAGYAGRAAPFVRASEDCAQPQTVTFPTVRGTQRNIDLSRGTLEFWYLPNYDALTVDEQHTLITVSIDGYNPPFLRLDMGGQLTLTAQEGDGTNHSVRADRLPLWTTGTWTHIRIAWDNAHPTDSLQIYVNDERRDPGGVVGGWSLAPEPEGMQIMVGGIAPCGHIPADGAIDELIIRR
jgi:hypothetical protein